MSYRLGILFIFISGILFAQTPDFSPVGYGAQALGGGSNGNVYSVSNLQELRMALLIPDSCIIEISDTIRGVFATKDVEKDSNLLEVKSHKTIRGIGSNAFLSNIQLYLKNAQNVVVRNIGFSMIGSSLGGDADIISIATTSSGECKNIWIDHCEFFNDPPTLPETSAKKDRYDGMIDIKKTSYNITISWNYFHDHWKCSLVGFTDTDTFDRRITYHHNYFRNIKSRVPSYRGGTGHIYNNYFEGLSDPANQPTSEGVHSRENACLKVEANYFKNYNKSIYSALDDVTFPGYAFGGNNVFESSPAMSTDSCSFSIPYAYILDSADSIPAIVTQWSGVGKLDPNAPSLSLPSNAFQSIEPGSAISEIVLYWGGGATDVSVSGLPLGLSTSKDFGNKAIRISGVPQSEGNFTIRTVGGEGSISRECAITFLGTDHIHTNPNPVNITCSPTLVNSKTQITFNLIKPISIELVVFSSTGKLMLRTNLKLEAGINKHTLQMDHFPAGIYFLAFNTGLEYQSLKIRKL